MMTTVKSPTGLVYDRDIISITMWSEKPISKTQCGLMSYGWWDASLEDKEILNFIQKNPEKVAPLVLVYQDEGKCVQVREF